MGHVPNGTLCLINPRLSLPEDPSNDVTKWPCALLHKRFFPKLKQYRQVNLFKKGLGVGVPGNQHENTYAQGEIHRLTSKPKYL